MELHHIPRKQNPDADALAKMVAERKPAPNGVFVNDLNARSARQKQPAVDKTKTGETEHAEKIEHTPSDPAPDQVPGGPTCLARDNLTQTRQTQHIGEPTYWLISFTKSSPRIATQPVE